MSKSRSNKKVPAKSKELFLIAPSVGNGTKVYYTREDDETIVRMQKNGKNNKEIAEKIGHSQASVTYRITRVLALMHSFGEYDYDKRELDLTADQKTERKAERQVAAQQAAVSK